MTQEPRSSLARKAAAELTLRDLLFPILIVAIAIFSIAILVASRRRPEPDEPARGYGVRCRVPACSAMAVRFGLRVDRSENFGAWMRTRFGAPPRWRIGWNVDGPLAYCRPHSELARAELGSALVRLEEKRLRVLRDAEVELAHFEAVGLDTRLAELVKAFESNGGA